MKINAFSVIKGINEQHIVLRDLKCLQVYDVARGVIRIC